MWLALDIRAVPNDRLAAVLRDCTADQARETALETARADAEALNLGKSRFLANMSHELRTPLNAIMGFSDMMRERIFGALPGKYVEYADLIHDAGSHLLDLINDVLDMSKIEAAKYELAFEQMDAREPISAALRLMRLQADDAGVQLRGILPSGPLEVDADRRALKQITLNLISNALKFTPRGGLVTVSLHALAGAMELSVADTGIGIAEADLERLGRPYEQAGDAGSQAKGTGLGLSLVRAFAELHGGEMSIESRLGEGTAVFVRLPVLAVEAESPRRRRTGAAAAAPVRRRPGDRLQASALSGGQERPAGGEIADLEIGRARVIALVAGEQELDRHRLARVEPGQRLARPALGNRNATPIARPAAAAGDRRRVRASARKAVVADARRHARAQRQQRRRRWPGCTFRKGSERQGRVAKHQPRGIGLGAVGEAGRRQQHAGAVAAGQAEHGAVPAEPGRLRQLPDRVAQRRGPFGLPVGGVAWKRHALQLGVAGEGGAHPGRGRGDVRRGAGRPPPTLARRALGDLVERGVVAAPERRAAPCAWAWAEARAEASSGVNSRQRWSAALITARW